MSSPSSSRDLRAQPTSNGLEITLGNSPARWRLRLEGDRMDDVVAVAIFASIDEPVTVHLLRVDLDGWKKSDWDDPGASSRSRFEYQETYVGPVFASTHNKEVASAK